MQVIADRHLARTLLLWACCALLLGCTDGSLQFFDEDFGPVESTTYAVGARATVMAFGPPSLDMSLLEMRATDIDGERGGGPFEVTDPAIFFEAYCVAAEVDVQESGPGVLAVAPRLSAHVVDQVIVDAAPVVDLALVRTIEDWTGGWQAEPIEEMAILTGSSTELSVLPVGEAGAPLAGYLEPTASTGGAVQVQQLERSFEVSAQGPAVLELEAGDVTREYAVDSVPASAIVDIDLERVSEPDGDTALFVVGITADSREVLGLHADWRLSEWDYEQQEGVMLDDVGQSGRVCWNGICLEF